jgi:NAD dependent epimerase/dehydratase
MILVTGADGFIGSHLVEHLVRAGQDVRAMVLYNSFNDWGWLEAIDENARNAIEVVAGDVRDFGLVRSALQGCDRVAHLAALVAIPHSYASPESYIDTNVKGTLNVVQAARDQGVSNVVHTSTSEVYGTARSVPMSEEHPVLGQSPYAASKIGADQIALAFHRSFGTPVTIVRPFNTYGPRQSARAVIPAVIMQLAAGERQLRLGSLHPVRDFSFVADTVRGIAAALETDAAIGEVVNLGSGFEISIGEVVRLIAEVMDIEVEVSVEAQRVRPEGSEVERLCADNSKALSRLGWKPVLGGVEGLREGLRITAEWFCVPENLSRYKTNLYNL